MPVSGEQAKSQYEKNGTVRDESIFCIEKPTKNLIVR